MHVSPAVPPRGLEQDTQGPEHTGAQTWSLHTRPNKKNRGSVEKRSIPLLGQEKYKVSLEHL